MFVSDFFLGGMIWGRGYIGFRGRLGVVLGFWRFKV